MDQPPFPLPNVPVPIYLTIQSGGEVLPAAERLAADNRPIASNND